MALPFIGSSITLISKAEIRYSGLLAEIDQQKATVTLKDVKSFGTEGRRPGYDVLPSEQIYEYIVFRGSDIKDLQVTGVSQQAPPQDPKPVPNNDPAIVSAISSAAHSPQHRQQRPAAPVSDSSNELQQGAAPNSRRDHFNEKSSLRGNIENRRGGSRGRGNHNGEDRGEYSGRGNHGGEHRGDFSGERRGRGGVRAGRGRGGSNESNRENFGESAVREEASRPPRRQPGRSQQNKSVENEATHSINVPNTDFDFESANSKLNKQDIARQGQNGHDQTAAEQEALVAKLAEIKLAAENVYDKKTSFFDNLSSEHQDRLDRSTQNAEIRNNYRNDDRKLNMETFGVASIYINSGGRGGRGRGGRGRGRGRGAKPQGQ